MKIIESIEIRNYKSFIHEKINLSDKIALIGANESGKSNVLFALQHLSLEFQKTKFKNSDRNISVQHTENPIIELAYEITLSNQIVPTIGEMVPDLIGRTAILTKTGLPNDSPVWRLKLSRMPKMGSLATTSSTKNPILTSLKKAGFDKQFIDQVFPRDFIIGGYQGVNFSHNPWAQLIREGRLLSHREGEAKQIKLETIIRDEILRNINIYFWRFDPNLYLKERIDVEDFCSNYRIKKHQSVRGIFQIAKNEKAFAFEINAANLRKNLIETDGTSRVNLLEKRIAKSFNSVFNKSWKSFYGKKISLKINYEDSCLTFRFDDGQDIPPEYRSDGFKWFITFMINFQSKLRELENFVLLIDEPGGNLHPKGQKDALEFINRLNIKNQVIYSTHQTFLIDKNDKHSVRILDRKLKKRDFHPTKVYGLSNLHQHILKDQLLRESLGFTLSDISPINDKNVLVEGTFDRNILLLANEYHNVLNFNDVSIIDCGKATNIKYSAQQLDNSGLKVVCLYDSDRAGRSAAKNNDSVADKYKLLIADEDDMTIEDLLPRRIFTQALNELRSKYRKEVSFRKANEENLKVMQEFDKTLPAGLIRPRKAEFKHFVENKMIEGLKSSVADPFEMVKPLLERIKDTL